jgi:signal transduction histidine kinase
MDSAQANVRRTDVRLRVVGLFVVLPTLVLIAYLLLASGSDFDARWLFWVPVIAGIELLPVPTWRGLTISVGFPLLMMLAMLIPPGPAGLVTFLGASDPREFKREVGWSLALFNRSQVALSVVAASEIFHAMAVVSGDHNLQSSPATLVVAAGLAALADYAVNASLVTLYMSTKLRVRPFVMLRQLTIGSLRDFLVSYLGLGLLGLAQAVIVSEAGVLAVPAFLAPVIFARQMFFRTQALEEAHQELKEREEILRELSNTMAEERADERLQIAGYLHDDLAQVLFRLSLQVDIARKLLERGDVVQLRKQLDKIRDSKQDTSDRIRALIRDLHRSPLGAKGLAEAIESFTDEVARDSGVFFHRDIEDIDLPAPIALLVFHITREGLMNALKHAQASDMWIRVLEEDDDIVLQLEDNGRGFNTNLPGPEGHFGMAMMRDRAKVGGGSFEVESEVGKGTTITVRFPTALLMRGEQQPDTEQGSANATGHASPGTTGTTPRAAEDSPDSVPA